MLIELWMVKSLGNANCFCFIRSFLTLKDNQNRAKQIRVLDDCTEVQRSIVTLELLITPEIP